MQIKELSGGVSSFGECLNGKRRIMTYGAGSLADDIERILKEQGYQVDYRIVDNLYFVGGGQEIHCRTTPIIFLEELCSSYDPQTDVVIWAIGSPEKLHNCMNDERMSMEFLLVWDMGFWNDRNFASLHKKEFDEASELLYDVFSKKVFWSYLEAQKGNIRDDLLCCTPGTYFNELTKGKRNGLFVDCGAYDGESSLMYMKFIGAESEVIAFEPDEDNYQNLMRKMRNQAGLTCLKKGCYSAEKKLSFASNGDMTSSLQETGKGIVEVTTIDKAVGERQVAFIKMDVEGAEYEALKGAKGTIERDMPILAISAYHRQEDLITLLPYISKLHSQNEKYHLYLRHHSVVASELVVYAVPVACLDS